ncbi:MAG: saccharopine dehydrogenase NADP-binding domain-containing protein [Bacteroidetes bacterium]|nr:saccharopine dehydrogenase NADP-binding domain-containing protein [Bacteroidota bacterium]
MSTQPSTSSASAHREWLIYGANGYTGRLIAEAAVKRGLRPVLAGRTEGSIRPLAQKLGCDFRIFSLDDHDAIARNLADVFAVLHCAGPFSRTAVQMVDACLATSTQYVDITGEIPVLESIYARHERAVAAGVALLPAAGYDVVPTDCLAAMLKEALPDAVRLRLAFAGTLSQSPGTWRVTLETIPQRGTIRENGMLRTVPHAWRIEPIRFDDRKRCTMSIPWGDVVSAYRSTAIPNIHVAAGIPCATAMIMRVIRGAVCALLRIPVVLRTIEAIASRMVKGPSKESRRTRMYHLRGDVWNNAGEHRSICLHTPEGYTCTVESTLAVIQALLAGRVPPGAWTPSQALGSGFALELPGVRAIDCPEHSDGIRS